MNVSNGIAHADTIGVKMSRIRSAPAQEPEDDSDNIGTWLCDKGESFPSMDMVPSPYHAP